MNGNVIRTITIRGQSEGIDKLTADVNKLAAAQTNVAVVSEQSAKRVLSLEDAWKRQTLRLDEAARAQANIARETKVADAALREGIATQTQHAQRIEQINQRYATATTATKTLTMQTGLARHELVNLGRQAQDVGVSLASGQSPFTVLIQQGTQIADVFATSGGTLRGFFSQAVGWAKGFFTSTTGIVTSVLAIGAAIVYAGVKWADTGKTIEQVLEETNRLLKETKTLIDAKASAESKAFAQSQQLTQYQILQDERDLRVKINEEMTKAISLAQQRAATPTQVAGEMGQAPTGFGPRADPGYDKITAAFQTMQVAISQGLPGVQQYHTELAKIAAAHPELAATVNELIKAGQTGIQLENAARQLQIGKDALAGIATNAERAAIGLAGVAQNQLNAVQIQQSAAATERMAQATLRLSALYPGMSIEVAKQLDAMNDQVRLNNARLNGTEDLVKAEIEYKKAIAAGTTELEAQALKDASRRVAASQAQQGENRAWTTHNALTQQADQELQDVGQSIQQNISFTNQWSTAVEGLTARWEKLTIAAQVDMRLPDLPTQFGDKQYSIDYDPLNINLKRQTLEQQYGAGNVEAYTVGTGFGQYTDYRLSQSYIDQQNANALAAHAAGYDVSSPGAIQKSFENALSVYGTGDMGVLNRLIGVAAPDQQASLISQTIEQIRRTEPAGLAREEKIQTLSDKLEQLTKSTDSLNSTMQDALSPFYSQDPRTTKLGFRAGTVGNPDWMTGAGNANPLVAVLGAGATAPGMAGGGSFVVGGGDSANDNRMAVFPVASGEQVVVNRNREGRGGQVVNIDNRIIVTGRVDEATLSKMKISRYQQAQRMRGSLAQA